MQARILTISPDVVDYANEVAQEMKQQGIRAEVMSGQSPTPSDYLLYSIPVPLQVVLKAIVFHSKALMFWLDVNVQTNLFLSTEVVLGWLGHFTIDSAQLPPECQ